MAENFTTTLKYKAKEKMNYKFEFYALLRYNCFSVLEVVQYSKGEEAKYRKYCDTGSLIYVKP